MQRDEDKVVREIDVYITDGGDPDDPDRPGLALLQYPVRARTRGPEPFKAARTKPKNKLLEVDVPAVQSGPHFDPLAPERTKLKARTLAGGAVVPATNYAVGTLQDGALYLAPLAATYQLRPSFAYVDAADEAEPPAAVEKKPERKLQAATVKPQNLGTGKTQRSSYAEMRQKQDLEPWVKLEVIPGDDPRGTAKRARLALAESEEDEEEDEEG